MGITLGNSSLYIPIISIILFIVIQVYIRTWCYRPPPHHKYTKNEQEAALMSFAVLLLMTRDQIVSEKESNQQNIKVSKT